MIVKKKIRVSDIQPGDVTLTNVDSRYGVEVSRVERTKKGKILVMNRYGTNPIFGLGLDPKQWIYVLVEGEPDPIIGLYEI